ncbi:RICIN domain-containing protein [Actinocorallia populi]|uniref:RICIN domain-containing protein n=1 Tax=Actinocorallia populi TaxID=2079200 RepID=UPI000D08F1ED|nr:RICIN domain-containing protein [Actinocorallia populi]
MPHADIRTPQTSISGSREALTDGVKMIVHDVTGGYLFTDNYNDNIGEAIQIWNEDALRTDVAVAGHRWYIAADDAGTYRIESGHRRHVLTASTVPNDHPRLRERSAALQEQQRWHLVPSLGTGGSYVIVPVMFPRYALGPYFGIQTGDVYVKPTRMWLDEPAIGHIWRIGDAPEA